VGSASQKAHRNFLTKNTWLMLLGEIIYVYGNNNSEQNHVPCAQNGVINTCNMWYYCGLDGAVLEDSLIKLSIKTCGK
jgi:hypothetical protein